MKAIRKSSFSILFFFLFYSSAFASSENFTFEDQENKLLKQLENKALFPQEYRGIVIALFTIWIKKSENLLIEGKKKSSLTYAHRTLNLMRKPENKGIFLTKKRNGYFYGQLLKLFSSMNKPSLALDVLKLMPPCQMKRKFLRYFS